MCKNSQRKSHVPCLLIVFLSLVSAFLFLKVWWLFTELNRLHEDQQALQSAYDGKIKEVEELQTKQKEVELKLSEAIKSQTEAEKQRDEAKKDTQLSKTKSAELTTENTKLNETITSLQQELTKTSDEAKNTQKQFVECKAEKDKLQTNVVELAEKVKEREKGTTTNRLTSNVGGSQAVSAATTDAALTVALST